MSARNNYMYIWALGSSLALILCLSIYFLPPVIEGDTPSYIEAITVLQGGDVLEGFVPNRILTTFGALTAVRALSGVIGVWSGWILLNLIFYLVLCVTFYLLVFRMFRGRSTALLATLFLASSYSILQFGLTYLMDIGGWAFYVVSIYFTYQYIESKEYKDLLYASALVGVGALFKEYALLAAIPIAVVLVWQYWRTPVSIMKRAILPAILALLPTALVYLYVFHRFNYSYIDWLSFNQGYYTYSSRAIEYIKSLGSLYNFLAPLVLGGLYVLTRERRGVNGKTMLFIISVLLSTLPILFWPAITQRILFITVPTSILLASFLFKKYERYWWVFLSILVVYILVSFTMDSYILPNLNLPF